MSRARTSPVSTLALGVFVILLTATNGAHAGNLYFSGEVGLAGQSGESGGANTRFEPFSNSGDDTDSTPVFGGTFGYEFPLDEALPWEVPLPSWLGSGFRFPAWTVRPEIEGRYRLDSEFLTDGFSDATPYRTQVSAWSLMHNLWVDMPIHPPIAALFGRVPILEPMSITSGVGLGLGSASLDTTDSIVSGDGTRYGFAWQVGTGIDYALTEWAHIGLGYRYLDLGEIEVDLTDGPQDAGDFSLDLVSHEVTLSLRFNFWSLPFPRRGR
jgi:hypothetical protein